MALTTHYFRDLVTNETQKLNQLCDKWTQIMDNESNIPEDGFGQIRLTIGQTNLFISQRFKQFIGLIDDCELKRGQKETKVEDLHGFWEMIYYQVVELHNKFETLLTLKNNNWIEAEPEVVKQPLKKKIPSKTQLITSKNNSSEQTSAKPLIKSTIRDQIQSLKTKNLQSVSKNDSFGEKENLKVKNSVDSSKPNPAKTIGFNKKLQERQFESSEVRNVLKRTPLLNSIKK